MKKFFTDHITIFVLAASVFAVLAFITAMKNKSAVKDINTAMERLAPVTTPAGETPSGNENQPTESK